MIYVVISFIHSNYDIFSYVLIFTSQILVFFTFNIKKIENDYINKTNIIFLSILLISFFLYLYQINFNDFDQFKLYREGRNYIKYYKGFTINPNVSLIPFYFIFLLNLIFNKIRFCLILFIVLIIVTVYTNSRINFLICSILGISLLNQFKFSSKLILLVLILVLFTLIDYLKFFANNFENYLYFLDLQLDKFVNETSDSKRFYRWDLAFEEISWNFFGKGFSYYSFKYGFFPENSFLEFVINFGIFPSLVLFIFYVFSLIKNINKISFNYLVILIILIAINFNNSYLLFPIFGVMLNMLKFRKYEKI